MKIDKELYRKAYESLRQWSEAERIERIRDARRLTPQERWQHLVDLFEFGRRAGIRPNEHQRARKLAGLNRYYERIRKLEAWRRARGR
ncbi:MAG TPA: hypothetical protein VIK33_10280 [Anaerolineae bacterium]